MLRPKMSPVAPPGIDWRALSSIASSPALVLPVMSTSVRLADRMTASTACWVDNCPSQGCLTAVVFSGCVKFTLTMSAPSSLAVRAA